MTRIAHSNRTSFSIQHKHFYNLLFAWWLSLLFLMSNICIKQNYCSSKGLIIPSKLQLQASFQIKLKCYYQVINYTENLSPTPAYCLGLNFVCPCFLCFFHMYVSKIFQTCIVSFCVRALPNVLTVLHNNLLWNNQCTKGKSISLRMYCIYSKIINETAM